MAHTNHGTRSDIVMEIPGMDPYITFAYYSDRWQASAPIKL